jgi:ATP-binding cassette subfamily F protein 3
VSLVVFDHVSLWLGGKAIVEDLVLRVGERERIGLVGPNGSGKTTLMRLMAGEMTPDGGMLHRRRDLRIGYLSQDVVIEGGKTLLDLVLSSVPGRKQVEEDLARVNADLDGASTTGMDEETMLELAEELASLHERLAHFETQFSEHEAKRILTGLGFKTSDHDRDVGELSGGWRMRGVLASLLFQRPDLLLLDEPTNHLDMPSVAWFSSFMRRYDHSFILISHDREFLNEQIAKVVTFEQEGIRQYDGDYEAYRRQREEEEVLLDNRLKNQEREREHLEQFVNRFRAKASKAAAVQSRVKKLEKLEDIKVHVDRKKIAFRFPTTVRPGREVLTVKGLRKRYGQNEVLRGVDLTVERGDRIAILGVNGAGKTTLLRILAGEIDKDGGEYAFGHNVSVGYYAQHHADSLRKDSTMYDEVKRKVTEGGHQQIRAALGAMLFGDLEVEKKIGVLSGGERARVALAQLLVDPGNLLFMDEPTNHLDLDSSERLADAIETFDGTLLFVSHNKAFVRRLAKKIWFVEDGRVEVYPGTFDDFVAKNASDEREREEKTAAAAKPKLAPMPTSQKEVERPKSRDDDRDRKRKEAERRNERTKKLKPLEKRVAELEARIAELEKAQAGRTRELEDPALYADAAKRDAVMRDFSRAQAELDVANEAWMEESEKLEQARAEIEAAEAKGG